jgi:hypothetical protein
MLLPPNEMVRASLVVYSDYSDRDGDFSVSVAPSGTSLLIPRIPTIFARNIIVAAFCNGSAVNATLIFRKYFMAGLASVDETFVLVNGAATVFSSTSPLEEVEIYLQNNDPANAIAGYGTAIARQ